jgi:hypothetical protein
VANFAGSHIANHVDQFMRDRHRRACLVAIQEEHQSPVAVRDLSQGGAVAEGQTSGRRGIQRINAAQELPLRRRKLDPIAAVPVTMPFGTSMAAHSAFSASAEADERTNATPAAIHNLPMTISIQEKISALAVSERSAFLDCRDPPS